MVPAVPVVRRGVVRRHARQADQPAPTPQVLTPTRWVAARRAFARIYDLRSTFASNALAAGVTPFELAKIMGTSVQMIERSYGTLLGGAHAGIAGRLDAHEAELEKAAGE